MAGAPPSHLLPKSTRIVVLVPVAAAESSTDQAGSRRKEKATGDPEKTYGGAVQGGGGTGETDEAESGEEDEEAGEGEGAEEGDGEGEGGCGCGEGGEVG